jgi:thiol-disulfide isomerase/thioredoxin
MNRTRAGVVLSLVGLMIAPAAVGEPTLKVGDAAPPLAVGTWLKGGPVKALEPGTVYVIECWATWCGPCIGAMPHVTRLQAKYRDQKVVVIGANVWERDPAGAEPFVKKMGDRMGYAVASDDVSGGQREGKMARTWLKAAGRTGIPCSFLVDRTGRVAWIGHPMMMERPLALLAADKFDLAAEAKFTEKLDALSADYGAAFKAGETDKALGLLEQLAAMNPTMAEQYQTTKVSLLVQKRDYAGAEALARALAEKAGAGEENPLASLAAGLLGAPDGAGVDRGLAIKLATRAYDAAGENGWQYAGLLARAYAADHQFDKAAEMQAKLVERAPERMRAQLRATLAEYKQKAGEKR